MEKTSIKYMPSRCQDGIDMLLWKKLACLRCWLFMLWILKTRKAAFSHNSHFTKVTVGIVRRASCENLLHIHQNCFIFSIYRSSYFNFWFQKIQKSNRENPFRCFLFNKSSSNLIPLSFKYHFTKKMQTELIYSEKYQIHFIKRRGSLFGQKLGKISHSTNDRQLGGIFSSESWRRFSSSNEQNNSISMLKNNSQFHIRIFSESFELIDYLFVTFSLRSYY